MKKILKILIISALILIAFCIPVIIAITNGASALSGFLFSLSVLSLILLFMLFRAIWLRWREKKFINGILEQEKGIACSHDKQISGELAKRWKESMGELKKSHLKHMGNPLYVLPWYMLIGESGSGKTTAIKNSGLSSKFASPVKVSGTSGTKNCDWWFFEQAIIIDTAGRYAIHQDEVSDRGEWRLFLAQLAKYRRKEPLNGLIISISSDKLLKSSSDDIEEEGKKIRVRIEELMQSLGAKFPVYLLVTKCDLIYGMKQFCDLLPEKAHGQAFGYLNTEFSNETPQLLIDKAFNSLTESLGNYRLRLSNLPGNEKVSPEVLLFPEEFGMLKKGLKRFIDGAFNKSVYQESPFLRGVYFTSGRQSGEPHSYFINKLGFNLNNKQVSSDRSYFLFDFFSKILPSDRGLFTLTKRALEWKKKIKAIKLSAWAVSVLALCAFLSWSFGVNLVTIKKFQKEFSTPPVLYGALLQDLNTLENFKESILKIEKKNEQSWLPGFGLNHCEKIEKDLKKAYCSFFKDGFISLYDKRMTDSLIDYSASTSLSIVANTIPHYIKRINLIKSSLISNNLKELKNTPQPDYKILVLSQGQNLIPKSLELLENQYLYYLLWADHKSRTEELEQLKSRLEFIVTKKEISMQWLVTWCNENSKIKRLSLNDFWFGRKNALKSAQIEAAYTVKGSELIEVMLCELEKALDTPLNIEKKKIEFRQWYNKAYIDEWFAFGKSFHLGLKTLDGEADKIAVAKRMATGKGPYFSLLNKMAVELQPCVESDKELPQWVGLVFDFDEIKKYSAKSSAVNNKGLMGNIAKKGLRLFGKAGKLAGNAKTKTNKSDSLEILMVLSESYKRYLKGLSGISMAVVSPISSFKLASNVFNEDPAIGESAVFVAQRSIEELRLAMFDHKLTPKMFDSLISGPLDYLWAYVCGKTGCQIQKIWDEAVLSEIQGVYDSKILSDLLFGKNGYVNKFIAKDAAPFIQRSRRKGFHAKTAVGEKIPFLNIFFKYLTKGAFSVQSEKAEYLVKLKALPTDTNSEAKLIPHVTKLELACAEGTQLLENYNYPVNKTFVWSPRACGDVSLKIHIGDLVLEKKYTGFRPFAKFLKDFAKGQHTFYRKDFPAKIAALKRMDIEYIKVKYNISGGRPVISLLNMAAGNAPEVIIKCSD